MQPAAVTITPDIDWVGALDPDLRVFDIIMKTERGTTYNAYLIRGGDKTALIDTVKIKFIDQLIARIKAVADLQDIDYIVLNHFEPDHSGSLANLLEVCGGPKVVISKTAPRFLENILNRNIDPLVVSDNDQIDLGGKTLRFYNAPFLHWPDTMFTYAVEDRVLMSCDVLGCHYCDPKLFDDLVDPFDHAFKYYFSVIMRPFKQHMLTALDKIENINIDLVAPSHGPILRDNPRHYIELYRQWCRQPGGTDRKQLLIFYMSIYNNTAAMANTIAEAVRAHGVDQILFDILGTELHQVVDLVEAADGILVGSPTINGDAVKPAWDLLSSLATLNLKGKIGGAFGSFGWSGEAVGMIEQRLKSLKFKVIEPGPRAKLVPSEEELEQCGKFGKQVAEAVKALTVKPTGAGAVEDPAV